MLYACYKHEHAFFYATVLIKGIYPTGEKGPIKSVIRYIVLLLIILKMLIVISSSLLVLLLLLFSVGF